MDRLKKEILTEQYKSEFEIKKRSDKLSVDFNSVDQLKSHRDILTQQLEMLDYSRVIVPVNVGVKFRPPKIGIEFYLKNDESFNRSISRKGSHESLIINDLDNF